MKKVMVLFAVSFFLISASYAQSDSKNQRTDTTVVPNKTMKKNMRKGKGKMDSTSRGNGSLYPMNNGTGRADSTNSGNGSTMIPNQTPGTIPTPSPSQTPTAPTQTPNQTPGTTPIPSPSQTPTTTPAPAPTTVPTVPGQTPNPNK